MVPPVPLDEPRNALADRRGRGIAAFLPDAPDVGVGFGDIPGLKGQKLHLGRDAQRPADDADHVHQVLGAVVADVEDFIRVELVGEERARDALDDVV